MTPRTRSRPRPILKRDMSPTPLSIDLPFVTCDYIFSPHVHFPPTPWMASMRFTHSPHTYDRAPIVVSPNACLLPNRGERKPHSQLRSPAADLDKERRRGRSRSRSSSREREEEEDEDEDETDVKGSYFHPRAYEACAPEPLDVPSTALDLHSLPSLVPDLSPSDDPDDAVITPLDPSVSAILTTPIPLRLADSPQAFAASTPSAVCGMQATDGSLIYNLPAMLTSEGKRSRPILKRSGTARTRVTMLSPSLDEGCLGGF
ncbi:uncharacterized protein LAESUDRAFT_723730 [Laetiporus sulphureus 93-53]|uniref:Uncharacterized protein n=1 Tax=Laetiporus sulphureus 93-53 TaxID=1314785 RepID=A0A165FDD2_9APHY|nr:uncharacterized protein LAESUDRAFT_723730 [Laetiporus sulphureus 93-53]KZT08798.1 hypothetical protein LAESUDRAFT_723730 [Laetiporus sulphureus 93-53]